MLFMSPPHGSAYEISSASRLLRACLPPLVALAFTSGAFDAAAQIAFGCARGNLGGDGKAYAALRVTCREQPIRACVTQLGLTAAALAAGSKSMSVSQYGGKPVSGLG
jgi:hypothetical protein